MTEVRHSEGRNQKAFIVDYDQAHGAMMLRVLNDDNLFPLYIEDRAGTYRIIRTATGKLKMEK